MSNILLALALIFRGDKLVSLQYLVLAEQLSCRIRTRFLAYALAMPPIPVCVIVELALKEDME
jgi:hypothetical protein